MSENSGEVKFSARGPVYPKSKLAFAVQSLVLVIVIVTCVANLSLGNGNERVWLVLLGTALGVVLPNPSVRSARMMERV